LESGEVHTWSRTHEGQTYVGFVNPDINKPARALLPKSASGPFRKVLGDGTVDAGNRGTGIGLGPAGVVVIATGGG
jgi:hypothetical protein